MNTDLSAYWDDYYRRVGPPSVPSQFAAFVCGEIPADSAIVDIGCGNGRDSLFFSTLGRQVLGVDASAGAIEACQKAAANRGLKANFLCSSIDSPGLAALIGGNTADAFSRTLYARFVLHAINETIEDAFFAIAGEVCQPGDLLAVEFRTTRDSSQPKATADHYRRFIEPMTVVAKAIGKGFFTAYYVEGFGLAKYRNDDAYVARCIFRKG